MILRRVTAAICGLVLLSSCAARDQQQKPLGSTLGADPANNPVATVATALPYCPMTGQPPKADAKLTAEGGVQAQAAPVVAALLPILLQVGVQTAVKFGTAALKNAAEGKVEISSAAPIPVTPFMLGETDLQVDVMAVMDKAGVSAGAKLADKVGISTAAKADTWKWNPAVACIVVARGRLGSAAQAKFADDTWKTGRGADAVKALGLVEDPDLYFEASLVISQDGAAYHAKPEFFTFRKSTINSLFSNDRDVLIAVSVDKASAPGRTDLSASPGKFLNGSVITLKDVRPGALMPPESFKAMHFQMVPLGAVSDDFAVIAQDLATLTANARRALADAEPYLDGTAAFKARLAQEAVDDAELEDEPKGIKALKIAARNANNDKLKAETFAAARAAATALAARRKQLNTFLPANINIAIAETKDASGFLLALATALEEQEGKLIEAGVSALKPKTDAEKRQNEIGRRNNELAAIRKEELVAQKEAELAEARANGTSAREIVKLEGELRILKYEADTARIEAGLPPRY